MLNDKEFYFKNGEPDYELYNEKLKVVKAAERLKNEVYYIRDLYTRSCIYMTKPSFQLCGYNQDEISEMDPDHFKQFIRFEELEVLHKVAEPLRRFISNVEVARRKYIVINITHQFSRKSGYQFPVLLRVTPFLFDDSGESIWLLLGKIVLVPNEMQTVSQIQMADTGELFKYNFEINDYEPSKHMQLTKMEKEVLSMAYRGYLEKEIAEELSLSVNTIKTHKRNLLKKLNAKNVSEAFLLASGLKYV
jgi:DNA-binding CsgD family transcriptional regulator